jgi:hypothetical protein
MIDRTRAEVIGIRALGWVAADPDRLGAFLAASGAAPGDLAGAAEDAGFLCSVLDFVLQADDMVLAFAASEGLAPTEPMVARSVLAGEAERHWT